MSPTARDTACPSCRLLMLPLAHAAACPDAVCTCCRLPQPTTFPLQERVHDKFVEALTARVAALRLGSGLEQGTTQGPLISAAAVDRVGRAR